MLQSRAQVSSEGAVSVVMPFGSPTRRDPAAEAGPGRRFGRVGAVTRLAALAVAFGLAAGLVHAPVAGASQPRVAVIVGPVGVLTDRFRTLGEEAALAAERAGASVIRVYSPDATWPAVRAAITGAQIVVYLGHGNGWPSPYRDRLYPPTQDGFGLNPVAGQDDVAHQYFGEQYVDDVRLAPGAVVLLSHLCYASGNSEPGLAEAGEADAIARVDNFAAGFLRAGARAVVAEAHAGPAWYVERLLRGSASIESLWKSVPWRHGHERTVASARTAGAVLTLDPDHPDGGWNRSLAVAAPGGSSRGGATGDPLSIVAPSLAWIRLGTPTLATRPAAGSGTTLLLPVPAEQRRLLPAELQVGLRWIPLEAPPDATGLPASGPSQPGSTAMPSPGPGASPGPGTSPPPGASPPPDAGPSASPGASPTPESSPVPDPDALVVPERGDAVVVTAAAELVDEGLRIATTFPETPGTYRLVATLHDRHGVAYDAATQALISPLIVTVPRSLAAELVTTLRVRGDAGSFLRLPVLVRNTGSAAWDLDLFRLGEVEPDSPWYGIDTAVPARLVGTWASTSGGLVPLPGSVAIPVEVGRAGGGGVVELLVAVPVEPGTYLLVLDIVSPSRGSLALSGVAPVIVEVRVSGG
jgi:hypothetical protein